MTLSPADEWSRALADANLRTDDDLTPNRLIEEIGDPNEIDAERSVVRRCSSPSRTIGRRSRSRISRPPPTNSSPMRSRPPTATTSRVHRGITSVRGYFDMAELNEQLGLTFPAVVGQLPKLAVAAVRNAV